MFIKKKIIVKIKRTHFKEIRITRRYKILKLFLIISLAVNNYEYYYFKNGNYFKQEPIVKIFIMTHKDFRNYRYNPAYTIVFAGKSQLKRKYNLNVLYANSSKLNKMNRAYGEMSQLYYIYELYKKGTLSSKYVGLNHYNKYFSFYDKIPNLDKIFKNYDVILLYPFHTISMKYQFCRAHPCSTYNQVMKIIQQIKPEYYKTAKRVSKSKKIYLKNLFIMKKQDFLKFCEFVFDVLFEFDRRNNLTSDEDVLNYVNRIYNDGKKHYFQSRLQGFLSERIGNIFIYHNFKRIKSRGQRRAKNDKKDGKEIKYFKDKSLIEKQKNDKTVKVILISTIINIILILIIII